VRRALLILPDRRRERRIARLADGDDAKLQA